MSSRVSLQGGYGGLPLGIGISTVMFYYVTKSDVFALRKDLVRMRRRGFPLGGLTRAPDCSGKSGSLTLGKNLTWF